MLLHVGIIPDGNRRWARLRGLTLNDAYEAGYSKLREVLEWLLDYDVRYVTVYAMSLDNCIKRSELEREILLKILGRALHEVERDKILERYDASLVVSGDLSRLPEGLRWRITNLTEKYGGGRRVLHIGLCYSTRWELSTYKNGLLPSLRLPPIDLVIRTGGMRRISGFFPLLVEYAELYFTDTLWPDFTRRELDQAIEWYRRQTRNFGK